MEKDMPNNIRVIKVARNSLNENIISSLTSCEAANPYKAASETIGPAAWGQISI